MHIKRHALATTALTGLFFSTTAFAQDATSAQSTDGVTAPVQEDARGDIVVTGVRQSIQKSLDKKRASSAQIEVITAEDVAKFPDVNVAEALSRLPGVTIDHSNGGEGNKVAILGIDSRLINVQLDGNNLATSEGGVPGGVGNQANETGRSFNFTNLPPEIIGDVEVYKSSQAKLDEGAVGGTIIVNTRNPLDLKPNTVSLSGNYNYNLRTATGNPRGSLFYSWHNDSGTLGFLGTIAYNKLELGSTSISVLSGYRTACNPITPANPNDDPNGNFGVNAFGGCNATGTAFANPSLVPKTTNGGPAITPTSLVPVNLNSGSFVQTEERLTLQGKIQWKPTSNLDILLSGYLVNGNDSNYNQAVLSNVGANYDDRNGYSSVNPVTNATNFPLTYTSVTTNADGNVTGGVLSHITEREDLSYSHQQLNTRQANLRVKWNPEGWNIDLNAGHTIATGGVTPQYFLSFYGHTTASYSLTADSSSLTTGKSLTDPTLFQSRGTGQQAGFVKTAKTTDTIDYGKVDVQKDVDFLDWIKKIEVGFKYQQHINTDYSHFYNTNVKAVGDLSGFSYLTSSPTLVSGLGASGDLLSYAYLSQADTIAYSLANRNPGFSAGSPTGDYNNTGNEYYSKEQDIAGYLQADFRHGRFHGDVGVRVAFTNTQQSYFSSQDYYPYIGDFQQTSHKYHDILPAANIVYDLNDKMDLRFTVAKVMSRPNFADQSGQVVYNIQNRQGSGGNPNLGPYRSTNFGASYEYYFAPRSLFSLDAFFRDISEYTVYRSVFTNIIVPQATLDYCNIAVKSTNGGTPACPGLTNPVSILLTTPYNGSHAKVEGLSASFQADVKYGFGIQTNATFLLQQYGSFSASQTVIGTNSAGAQAPVTVMNKSTKYPLPYLSKWSYTIAPYYEKDKLEVHTSYTWRSNYNVVAGNENVPAQFVSSFGQLDGSLNYHFTKGIEMNVSAVNILDPLVKPYSTGNLPLGFSRYGRRVSIGLTARLN